MKEKSHSVHTERSSNAYDGTRWNALRILTYMNYHTRLGDVNPDPPRKGIPKHPPLSLVHPSQIYLTDRTTKELIWLCSRKATQTSPSFVLSLPFLPVKFHLVARSIASAADAGRSMSRVHRPFFGWFVVNG